VNSAPIRRQTRDNRFTPIEETMSALNDLVKAGKVRYVGVSDAPAWKVAQAQMMAHFRGWNPLIALQIEYSLPGWGVLVRALHPHFSTGKTLLSSLGSRFVANSQVGPTTIFDRTKSFVTVSCTRRSKSSRVFQEPSVFHIHRIIV
jgi:predicted oxidoreductase